MFFIHIWIQQLIKKRSWIWKRTRRGICEGLEGGKKKENYLIVISKNKRSFLKEIACTLTFSGSMRLWNTSSVILFTRKELHEMCTLVIKLWLWSIHLYLYIYRWKLSLEHTIKNTDRARYDNSVGQYFVNLTQTRFIWKEGILLRKCSIKLSGEQLWGALFLD